MTVRGSLGSRQLRAAVRFGLAAGLVLAAASARAGTISLSLTTHAELRDGMLEIRLEVTNSGDEAARLLSPSLGFLDQTQRADVREALAPGETAEIEFTLPAPGLTEGRWPFRVSVDYADANDYPFHALHVGTVLLGTHAPTRLSIAEITAQPLAGSGTLLARLKNLGPEPLGVEVDLALPIGVELMEPIPRVELGPYEDRSLEARLVNRTALPGSRYAIFASAEYDAGDFHHTVVRSSLLEVAVAGPGLGDLRGRLWMVAVAIVFAWAGLALFRRVRAPSG